MRGRRNSKRLITDGKFAYLCFAILSACIPWRLLAADLLTTAGEGAAVPPQATVTSSFLQQAQATADDVIPHAFDQLPYNVKLNGGADNCGHGVSLGFHVQRSPVHLSMNGDTVQISTDLQYRIEARVRTPCPPNPIPRPLVYGSCGDGEPLRRMALTVAVDLGSNNAASAPTPVARIANLQPIDRCTVTVLNIDVTNSVTDAVRAAVTRSLDSLNQRLAQIH